MSVTTATPEFLSWLSQFKNATEIRDDRGTIVGVFVPQKYADTEELKSLFDWNEVKRKAATEQTGRPLRDIVRDLENREKKQ